MNENIYKRRRSVSLEALRVLDIGCGDGNLAAQFIETHPEIEFIGMDIHQQRIKSLKSTYSETNYDFIHANNKNDYYNPDGRLSADEFEFPFPDDYFDVVVVNAVFIHLLPGAIKNYLSEIHRVLADDGVAWTTWYLITNETDLDPDGKVYTFPHEQSTYYSMSAENPEQLVAYPSEIADKYISEADLHVKKSVLGYWRDPKMITDIERDRKDMLLLTPKDSPSD